MEIGTLCGVHACLAAVLAVNAGETGAHARRMVAKAAVGAVDVAQVAGSARALAALRQHAVAVGLVRGGDGVVRGWAALQRAVRPEKLRRLALARAEPDGPAGSWNPSRAKLIYNYTK